jgi:hypothetical protein
MSLLDMSEKCPLANSDMGNFREVDTISWLPHDHSTSQVMIESLYANWLVGPNLQLASPEQARKRGVRLQHPKSDTCVLNGNSGSPKEGNLYGDGVLIVVNRGNALPFFSSLPHLCKAQMKRESIQILGLISCSSKYNKTNTFSDYKYKYSTEAISNNLDTNHKKTFRLDRHEVTQPTYANDSPFITDKGGRIVSFAPINLNKVIHVIGHPKVLLLAYELIKSKKGNMSPGASGVTLDRMNLS